jgi:hypothetical protein
MYYSLTDTDKQSWTEAMKENGLDGEIALMRVIIKSLIANDPENYRALFRACEVLARLIVARHKIGSDKLENMKTAMHNVYRDIELPIFGDRK